MKEVEPARKKHLGATSKEKKLDEKKLKAWRKGPICWNGPRQATG